MNQQTYFITKMVSVTQYVHLMMLKRFNIYELDYKLVHFVASAVRFQRARPHTLLIGCDIWLIPFSVDTVLCCHFKKQHITL